MFLEKIGKKFAKGAKAEILNPESGKIDIPWDKVIKAGMALLELGVLAIAVFSGGASKPVEKPYGGTIVINNYISRREDDVRKN